MEAEGARIAERVYIMGPDGSAMRQLTSGNCDRAPELSPDGATVVFARSKVCEGYCSSIWVRDLRSGQETVVPETDDFAKLSSVWPTWSPGGDKIAFLRYEIKGDCKEAVRGGGHELSGTARIWTVVYRPSFGLPQQLSSPDGPSRWGGSWSKDATDILYSQEGGRPGAFTIHKISLASRVESAVIINVDREEPPKYSPDNTRITWISRRHWEDGDVYIAEVSEPTKSQRRLTQNTGVTWTSVAWSPDGTKLVLSSNGKGIWTMTGDGSDLHQVVNEPKVVSAVWWGGQERSVAQRRE